jgi:hypothetical protein
VKCVRRVEWRVCGGCVKCSRRVELRVCEECEESGVEGV